MEEFFEDRTIVQPPVNFTELMSTIDSQFPIYQILNEKGKLSDENGLPDLNEEEYVDLMEKMLFFRVLHEQTTKFSKQGRLGFYAPTLGQEAAQVGTALHIEEDDWLFPSYRNIPELIMHGATVAQAFLWSRGHVKGGSFGEDGQVKAYPPQIIIGAQIVQAAGSAIGQKLKGIDQVTFAYIGDGGTSQGDFYEGLNFAGRYKAPLIAIVHNNGYAISTPRDLQTASKTLAQKAVATGIPGVQVDGNDILAVYVVTKQAREWAKEGKGPVLIETVTSRMGPHSTAGDDPSRYRSQESLDFWSSRDPLIRYRSFLEEKDLWSEEKEDAFIEKAEKEIQEQMQVADQEESMKVSESLKWMYQNPPQHIRDQIKEYEAKGE